MRRAEQAYTLVTPVTRDRDRGSRSSKFQECCDSDSHENMEELATLPKHMQPVDMNKPAAQKHALDHGSAGNLT